jgi:ABC-type transport system involved in cytochrome c biogenesis ATPase subunit
MTASASLAAAPAAVSISEYGLDVVSLYYPSATCASLPALDCGHDSYGTQTLRKLNIDLEPGWKWGGVGFLIGVIVLLNASAALALSAVRISRNVGSSRAADEHEPAAADAKGGAPPLPAPAEERAVVDVAPQGSAASVLPFTPMTVTWRDVKYTVQLNKNLGGGEKTLLQGVSGIAVPGRLIALMGASGAGKSTLLDVIAGRKTAGKMEGGIFLNGFAREEKSFARLTAYCEQQDIHNAFATVREALAFSAALRLPSDVDAATRDAFVEEVVDKVKLRYIAHRLVGEVGAANGLSPGQRKILTMGVELVSNAPILFLVRRELTACVGDVCACCARAWQLLGRGPDLIGPAASAQDEPTSGLDAQAASMVIRAVRAHVPWRCLHMQPLLAFRAHSARPRHVRAAGRCAPSRTATAPSFARCTSRRWTCSPSSTTSCCCSAAAGWRTLAPWGLAHAPWWRTWRASRARASARTP